MNILAPIDFSKNTSEVIKEVRVLAKGLLAKVWLIHVAESDPDFVGYSAGPQSVRDQIAEKFKNEHQQLQDEAESLRESKIDATALLLQGPVVETLIEEAEKLNVDLIVMGSHGHGAVYRILVGSVCEGILHLSTCPVVVVPLAEKDKHTRSE